MARALVGDKSDNIQGIPGLGLKTVAKRFPIFQNQESVTFSSLMDYCKQQMEESTVKAYRSVVENEDLIRNNYHMMQLYTPSMSIDSKKEVRETLKNANLTFNKTSIITRMVRDGFDDLEWRELQAFFRRLVRA